MTARRSTPPPREGKLALATAIVTTIAVPGVGHLFMGFLARGLVWLIGNMAILLILIQGEASSGALIAILGALRVAALIDLLIALRVARSR